MANQIVWVDIPVHDLDRAIRFYSAVLGEPVRKEDMGELKIGLLPHTQDDTTGACLFKKDGEEPSAKGPLLYLNCQGRLDKAVTAVEASGGRILQPKHPIGPYGFRAVILDSEGNRLALHSM